MPRSLYPRKRPDTHCIGGWVGVRAGLDGCGKSHLKRDSIPGPSSPQRVTILTELSRFLINFVQNADSFQLSNRQRHFSYYISCTCKFYCCRKKCAFWKLLSLACHREGVGSFLGQSMRAPSLTRRGFSRSTSVFTCQYHSTNAPHSYFLDLQRRLFKQQVAAMLNKTLLSLTVLLADRPGRAYYLTTPSTAEFTEIRCWMDG